MKLKTLLIVIVVLAAVSGAVSFLNERPSAKADPRVQQPLVDAATLEKTAGLRLAENGKTVLLKKTGATWQVASDQDLPADFEKLARFVQELSDVKIERFVTANPQRLAGLEFKDTRISLLNASDHPLLEITLGKNAEVGGGRFLRFADEPKAYLAPFNVWLDTDSGNWVNHVLTRFTADDIARITLGFPDSKDPVVLSRPKPADPFATAKIPAGKQLNQANITSLIASLGGLRFTEIADLHDPKAEAARAHFGTIVFTTFAGKTITVNAGREPARTVVTEDAAKPLATAPTQVLKVVTPEKILDTHITKTIPAGPVFAAVTTSDPADPVNALAKKHALQVADDTLAHWPAKLDDLLQTVLPAKPEAKPAATKP